MKKGYTNVALFGLDSRENDLGKGNRSDTIIIASLNNDTEKKLNWYLFIVIHY